jgi:hypothetical protein
MKRGKMGDEEVDNHERLGQSPAIVVNERLWVCIGKQFGRKSR